MTNHPAQNQPGGASDQPTSLPDRLGRLEDVVASNREWADDQFKAVIREIRALGEEVASVRDTMGSIDKIAGVSYMRGHQRGRSEQEPPIQQCVPSVITRRLGWGSARAAAVACVAVLVVVVVAAAVWGDEVRRRQHLLAGAPPVPPAGKVEGVVVTPKAALPGAPARPPLRPDASSDRRPSREDPAPKRVQEGQRTRPATPEPSGRLEKAPDRGSEGSSEPRSLRLLEPLDPVLSLLGADR